MLFNYEGMKEASQIYAKQEEEINQAIVSAEKHKTKQKLKTKPERVPIKVDQRKKKPN